MGERAEGAWQIAADARSPTMLELVDVGPRSIEAYRGVAPDAILDDLINVAGPLRGARVLHVNATPYGSGVSELLRSAVPLLADLGLVAHWKIIRGNERFFHVTKKIHNGLRGATGDLTEAEREAYLGTARRSGELLEAEYDLVFLHDPQPAGMLSLRSKGDASWVWRCHIDTSQANRSVWEFRLERTTYRFCSHTCRHQFLRNPAHYLAPRDEASPTARRPRSAGLLP